MVLSNHKHTSVVFLYCLIALLALAGQSAAQRRVDVIISKSKSAKVYHIYERDYFVYKLKGDTWYRKNQIMHILDSSLVLDNGTEVGFSEVKKIRLHKGNHLVGTFQTVFFYGGLGFFALNTINQLIVGDTPVVDPKAAVVAAAAVSVSLLLRELNLKRVKVNNRVALRFYEGSYQNLGK